MSLVKLSGCGLTRNSNYIPINLFQLNFGDVYNRSSRKCLSFGNFVQFISSLFHKFIFVLEGVVKNSVEWRESNYSAYWSIHFLQLNLFFSKILNVNYYMHTCMYLLFYLKKKIIPKKSPFPYMVKVQRYKLIWNVFSQSLSLSCYYNDCGNCIR